MKKSNNILFPPFSFRVAKKTFTYYLFEKLRVLTFGTSANGQNHCTCTYIHLTRLVSMIILFKSTTYYIIKELLVDVYVARYFLALSNIIYFSFTDF